MKHLTARNCLHIVAKGGCDAVAAFGVAKPDFDLVTRREPWLGTDRERVVRVLNSLLFGSLDLLGLPRIQAPAEYIAAVLVTFVAPVNYQLACRFFEQSRPVDDLALNPGSQAMETVTASQLFAMVIDLYDPAALSQTAAAFEKRVGLAIEHAAEDPQVSLLEDES